jgi:hypothetical protein
MDETPDGLTDKLYWRNARGQWHCFKKLPEVRGYISLCQRREIALVLGQQIARPEADLRCREPRLGRHCSGRSCARSA